MVFSREIKTYFYLLVAVIYAIISILDYGINRDETDADKIKNKEIREARFYMGWISLVILVLACIDLLIWRRRAVSKKNYYCKAKTHCEKYEEIVGNAEALKKAAQDLVKKKIQRK